MLTQTLGWSDSNLLFYYILPLPETMKTAIRCDDVIVTVKKSATCMLRMNRRGYSYYRKALYGYLFSVGLCGGGPAW